MCPVIAIGRDIKSIPRGPGSRCSVTAQSVQLSKNGLPNGRERDPTTKLPARLWAKRPAMGEDLLFEERQKTGGRRSLEAFRNHTLTVPFMLLQVSEIASWCSSLARFSLVDRRKAGPFLTA
jgi:hypothetical protein